MCDLKDATTSWRDDEGGETLPLAFVTIAAEERPTVLLEDEGLRWHWALLCCECFHSKEPQVYAMSTAAALLALRLGW